MAIIINPPQGQKFGFPKPLPDYVRTDSDIKQWLLAEGYPDYMVDVAIQDIRIILNDR